MGSDQVETVSRPAWLAAYAVGLAVRVDGVPDAASEAVVALTRAAGGDASTLTRARRRLAELSTLDEWLRDGAGDLSDRAARAVHAPARGAC